MTLKIGIKIILFITTILFFIGLYGIILNRKNILSIILSIEIMLLAINLNFATLSIYLNDIIGYVFVIFILSIAAAESAIGLSIIMSFYKTKGSIQIEYVKKPVIGLVKPGNFRKKRDSNPHSST